MIVDWRTTLWCRKVFSIINSSSLSGWWVAEPWEQTNQIIWAKSIYQIEKDKMQMGQKLDGKR